MTEPTTETRGPIAQFAHRVTGVVRQYGDMPFVYLRSLALARRHRTDMASVKTFCLFIGHARSGHSVIGAALDAHRNIATTHEADALRWLRAGLKLPQIYGLLLDHERAYNDAGRPARYDYTVPGGWQGRFDELLVIGDKHGPAAARRLHARPYLLDRLRSLGAHVRVIQVVRNPFDNISTRAKMMGCDLDTARLAYFKRCEDLEKIVTLLRRDEYFMLRHEDFVADPEGLLRQLCQFLGVDAEPDYLQACASIVFDRPHRSRDDAPWTDELIAAVDEDIDRHPTLAGYRFEE